MSLDHDPAPLDRRFDLAVVGGGITGVCLAREAAARGRSVVLLEQHDFGSGTSAGITKYLHGGIRYLEQYDVKVVRESLRERRIMALAAPHLVQPTRFVLPVWSWSKPGRLLLGAGVAAYDALAFDRNRETPDELRIGHPGWLSSAATLRALPWLDPSGLRGAYTITDTLNVHPERLLLAILLDAVALGAVARNHTRVSGFLTEQDGDELTVTGVEVEDRLTGAARAVRADQVVNAAGPWMDEALRPLGRDLGVGVVRSKGVHVLTRPLGGPGRVDDAVLARGRSGRHVVVSPWQGRSFIGPTDTPIDDHPDDVRAAVRDVTEVLDTVNSCLGPTEAPLTIDDVEHATVGIRPLVVEEGKDSYSASRRHELYDHGERGVRNLWSIAGGKWTTGRAIAEDVLDRVLGPVRRSPTRRRSVAGTTAWGDGGGVLFDAALRARPELGLDDEVRLHLARLYGTGHTALLDLVADDPALGAPVSHRPGRHDIGAQVVRAITHEGARTLADVIDRRLVIGTLGPLEPDELERIAAIAAPLLGTEAADLLEEERTRRDAVVRAWRSPV